MPKKVGTSQLADCIAAPQCAGSLHMQAAAVCQPGLRLQLGLHAHAYAHHHGGHSAVYSAQQVGPASVQQRLLACCSFYCVCIHGRSYNTVHICAARRDTLLLCYRPGPPLRTAWSTASTQMALMQHLAEPAAPALAFLCAQGSRNCCRGYM